MPKIIDNLTEKLVSEARRQVLETGFRSLNIRAVAKNCGVGVGTVYNYFPSKEALVAAFLVDDWKLRLAAIHASAENAQSIDPILEAIYTQLGEFQSEYRSVFLDMAASTPIPSPRYHEMLRGQFCEVLRPFCTDEFTAQFVSEALLTWSVAGTPLEILRPLIHKVIA